MCHPLLAVHCQSVPCCLVQDSESWHSPCWMVWSILQHWKCQMIVALTPPQFQFTQVHCFAFTVSPWKYALFCTLLCGKSRVFSWIFNSSLAYAFSLREVDNHDNCCGFLEKWQLCWKYTREIRNACVDKSEGIEATYIISGDRGRPHVSLCPQFKQQKRGRWPVNNPIVILYVCSVYTQSTMS